LHDSLLETTAILDWWVCETIQRHDFSPQTIQVRFNAEERQRVEKAAKAKKQTVSEWIRSTLSAALEA
jgi:uncharacterized protein (DUF1778 family)